MGIPLGGWPPSQFTRQILRVAAVLLPAGAWDAVPAIIQTGQYDQALLYVAYTRGAVNGAVDFNIEVSPYSTIAEAVGANQWYQVSLYAAGGVVVNVDSASNFQRDIITYGATGAAAEHVVNARVLQGKRGSSNSRNLRYRSTSGVLDYAWFNK